MKKKYLKTGLLATRLIMFLAAMFFSSANTFAQTVSGTPSNTGCLNSGIVTASSTGLGTTAQYQLLKSGAVVAPVSGDASQFTNTNVFTGLLSGSYTVKGRATSGGTVYTSSNITVSDGYTAMSVATPTKVASCVGGTVVLTTTATGGKAPFIYKIATQVAPSTYLETSISTAAATYNFAALAVGSYLVSVTDACGQTVTGASSISNPTVSLADIKLGSTGYVNRVAPTNCTSNFTMTNELGFRYISNSATLSAADAALFTWKIKFQGVLYGQDTDADGFSDAAGAGFPTLTNMTRMPLVATRNAILADEPNTKIVLIDACGNQKEFSILNYNKIISSVKGQNRCGNAEVGFRIGAGISCLPINFVFTNTTNPADVVTITQTSNVQSFGGFTAGATYNFTYVDGSGYTSGLYNTNNVTIPTAPQFNLVQFTFGTQQSLNNLNYGVSGITLTPSIFGDAITATVTVSSNPLVNVGSSVSGVLDGNGNCILPRVNATDPVGFWPKGNYTLSVSSPCGTKLVNVVVQGYNASLSGNTITPVCGGFNYVMNGTFDVPSAYQVIIVSGPTGTVGQVRDLASTSASLPFNGLSYGTYVFGLRIKGGSTNVLTQTVTYSAANAITVDTANTGGYVCSAGATNGTLIIAATTNSPAPGNTLEYALSLDGGTTYGAYQSANTFSGLGDGIYYFKVKDGCGNIITQSAQMGVAAAPTASADGQTSPATFCNLATGTIQLDVDILGASSYLWSGPGITATNQNIKNPVINYNDLAVGTNNITCTITLGAPCNSTTVSNLIININPLPTIVVNNPIAVCFPNTVDITLATVTTGSDTGLTYTYFSNAAATITLPNPTAVGVSGTYYIKGTNSNGCNRILPITVTINPLPIATIAYQNGPYCNRGNATVTQTGVAGGTFSSDAGLIINSATGEINLAASTTGSHTITYSFSNGICANTTTAIVNINTSVLPTALTDVTAQCSVTPTAPTLIDPCAGSLTATSNTAFPITTQGTTIVTWTFNYGNGYTQTVDQNVILDDTVNPVTPTLSDVTGSCSVTPTAPTTTDACAGTITGTTTAVFPITAVGTTVITWTFNDGNGNSITANQNVTITNISKIGSESTSCFSDSSGYTVTVVVSGQTPYAATGTGAPGTWSGNTWTSGSIATGANYNVDITDTNACNILNVSGPSPVCSLPCSFLVTCPTFPVSSFACYSTIPTATILTEAEFEALGNADGVIGNTPCGVIEITAANAANPGCSGNVIRTYTVTEYDDVNNNNVRDLGENTVLNVQSCAQTYTISAPVVTMPANDSSTVACVSAAVAPTTPVVTDNCGRTVTAVLTSTDANPACAGTKVYTYTYTDCANVNYTWTYTYTISAPVVTMPANDSSTVACVSAAVAPTTPVVTDNCGRTVTAVLTSTDANPACAGTKVYTYTYTDCANVNYTWTYTYTIDDTIAPTGTAPANLLFQCIADVPVADVNAVIDEVDNCSGTVTVTVVDSNNGGSGCLGNPYIITRTYTLTDCTGLQRDLVQTITVEDNTSPLFIGSLPSNLNLECSDVIPTAPTLTATDNCSTATVIYNEVTTAGSCANNYILTRTWTATDSCTNQTVHTQVIIVQDTTPPVFTGILPQNGFADCDNIPVAPTLTATDNCGNVTITFDEQQVDGDCSSKYELIRTWTATNDCGISSTYTQTLALSCHIKVWNAVSPDGDGLNDMFYLEGIDCYPNNSVEVYNRWGVKVYETNGYNNVNNVFKGFSDGRATVNSNELLPTGTYFYILKYEYNLNGADKQNIEKSGYLYIQN